MIIYRYQPNRNEFVSVFLSKEVKEDIKKQHDRGMRGLFGRGRPLTTAWTPIQLSTYRGEPGEKELKNGDFPGLYSTVPVLSPRAWSVLEPYIRDDVEAFPATSEIGDLFLLNVLNRIDCLDLEKSKVRYNPASGKLSTVYTYALDKEKIGDAWIFMIPETDGVETLVTEKFKAVVEQAGLEGLRFKQIPEVME